MSREVAVRYVLSTGDHAACAQAQEDMMTAMIADGWEVVGWGQTTRGEVMRSAIKGYTPEVFGVATVTDGFMLYFGREKREDGLMAKTEAAAQNGLGLNRAQRRRMR